MRCGSTVRLSWALVGLGFDLLLPVYVAAQGDGNGPRLNSDALSIIGYTLIATFALASIACAVLGFMVALQWPHPHVCCFTESYNDAPRGRGCCSLYRVNFSFAVLWIVFFVVSAVGRRITQLLVCLGFALMHIAIVAYLRHKFNHLGYQDNQEVELPTAAVVASVLHGAPMIHTLTGRNRPAAGIAVYNIPISTAVVGQLGGHDACSCSTCNGRPLPAYVYAPADPGGAEGLKAAMAAALARAGVGGELAAGGGRSGVASATGAPAATPIEAVVVSPAELGSRALDSEGRGRDRIMVGSAVPAGGISQAGDVEGGSASGARAEPGVEPSAGSSRGPDEPPPRPSSGAPPPATATPVSPSLLLVEGIPVDAESTRSQRSSRRLRQASLSNNGQLRLSRVLSGGLQGGAVVPADVSPQPSGVGVQPGQGRQRGQGVGRAVAQVDSESPQAGGQQQAGQGRTWH